MLLQYKRSPNGDAKTNHHKINTLTLQRRLTQDMTIATKDIITNMRDTIMNMKRQRNTPVTITKVKQQNTVTRSFSRKPKLLKPLSKYGKFNPPLLTK